MFSVEERRRVRNRILAMAHSDARVISGADVGALANGGGDRWSDLDLTFGLADEATAVEVLDEWGRDLARELGAVHLFDLPFRSTMYRVFLLPGGLQVDLSFTPAREFGALGPSFQLLFGDAVERDWIPQPSPYELFGLGVHHVVRARFCIERGRWWQAQHWLGAARDQALSLACRRHGLDARHGRGFDQLPAEVLAPFLDSLARSVERDELLRVLDNVVAGLLRESAEVADVAGKVEAALRELTSATWP